MMVKILDLEVRKRARITAGSIALFAALLFTWNRLATSDSNLDGRRRVTSSAGEPVDPSLNSALLAQSENLVYARSGYNVFGITQAIEHNAKPKPTSTPSATPAPKITRNTNPLPELKFYGFARKRDQARQIFLSDGESIFIGREGDVVDRHYRIVRVAENTVELEDLLNNEHMTLDFMGPGKS